MAKIFLTLKVSGSYKLDGNSISFEDLHHLYYKAQIDKLKVTNAFGNTFIAKDTINDRTKTSAPLSTCQILALRVNEFSNEKIDAFFAFEANLVQDFANKLLQSGAVLNREFFQIENGNDTRMLLIPDNISLEVYKDKSSFNKAIKSEMSKEDLQKSSEALEKLEVINDFKHYDTLNSIVTHSKFKEEFLEDNEFVKCFINGVNTYFTMYDVCEDDIKKNLEEVKTFFEAKLKK